MPKRSYPLFEPRPAYMRAVGMLSARYVDGPGAPAGPAQPPADATAPPAAPTPPAVPPEPTVPPTVPAPTPEQVADLQARVAAFEAAEATRAQEAKDKADLELSDLQKAQRTIAEQATRIARSDALIAHPVPAEYQSLVQGTDAASFLASAKLASELAAKAAGIVPPPPKPDPIPGSGTQPPGGGATGSVQAGRDLYDSKNPKN